MKRVLVTGATGFIGRCCLNPLIERGYEVHALSLRGLSQPGQVAPEITWHRADLLQSAAVAALFQRLRPSHLLHLAWYAEPKKFWTAPENLAWTQATFGLLSEFARHGGQRAVLAGTCAEYNWRYGLCSERFTPCEPAQLYGACKHATRLVFDAWAQAAGLSGAWGRIFFLYGPHEHPTRLVRSVIEALLRGEPARCTQGIQRRDFLHVQDVAGAFVGLLESEVTGPVNIASGVPIAVRDVVACIARQLNASELVQFGAIPSAAAEPPLLYADISRLRDEVGFVPRFSLESGIAHTIERLRQEIRRERGVAIE